MLSEKEKEHLLKIATMAARKWFYETFEDDLLQQMEDKKIILNAEGFSVGMDAELQVAIEMGVLDILLATKYNGRVI